MKPIATVGFLLCLMHSLYAQKAIGRPRFSDYHVRQIYHGKRRSDPKQGSTLV